MAWELDFALPNGYTAGVDEVGRGPLAGPVIAAAVILDAKYPIQGLADSKVLSEKKREMLFPEICEKAISWSLGRAEVEEIDAINILQASLLAMQRAVESLSVQPQLALIDGNRCPVLKCRSQAIVKGDSRVKEIAAASIIAKVSRDREMLQLHAAFPQYGLDAHKGYPTKKHIAALDAHGISVIHRRSFGPVKQRI